MRSSNAELYSNVLLEEWSKKNHLLDAEDKLLSKYLRAPCPGGPLCQFEHCHEKTKKVLDVGTGGGRLAFYVEGMGINDISAFDIVPEMIEYANKVAKEKKSNIKFDVLDATNLSSYKNNEFDYLLYLQQVLNFIPEEKDFVAALNESYRVAKNGSIVLFAFLDYDSRKYNPILNSTLNILRKTRGEKAQRQRLPWIKLNNKLNWKILHKDQAVVYWVKKDEILLKLKEIGYDILEVKNANQFVDSDNQKRKGMLYIVCKK